MASDGVRMCDRAAYLLCAGVKSGVQGKVHMVHRDAQERLFLGEGALFDHVDGDFDGGLRHSLPVSALEHVQPSVLRREPDVLGIIGIIIITSS